MFRICRYCVFYFVGQNWFIVRGAHDLFGNSIKSYELVMHHIGGRTMFSDLCSLHKPEGMKV